MKYLVLTGLLVTLFSACTAGTTTDEIKEKPAQEAPIDTTITYVRNREIVVCDVQQATVAGLYESSASAESVGASFGITLIFAKYSPNGEVTSIVAGHPIAVRTGGKYLVDYQMIPSGIISPRDVVNLDGHGLTRKWRFQEGLHADAVLMDNPRPLRSDSTNVHCEG